MMFGKASAAEEACPDKAEGDRDADHKRGIAALYEVAARIRQAENATPPSGEPKTGSKELSSPSPTAQQSDAKVSQQSDAKVSQHAAGESLT
jgi:hypothetical protein